jgi:putative flippase GtrA
MQGIPRAFDVREFIRFVVAGVAAAAGNIATVWITRHFLPFEIALVLGIGAGLVTSFLLSKLFAFESRSWSLAGGEAARFLAVYSLGSGLYWAVAVVFASVAIARGAQAGVAEMGGVLIGSGVMMLSSYFGHRFFTYRTHQRDPSLGAAQNPSTRRPQEPALLSSAPKQAGD